MAIIPRVVKESDASGAQVIDGSLTLVGTDNKAYDGQWLTRTPSTVGNSRIWTWSGWIKRDKINQQHRFFGSWNGNWDPDDFFDFRIDANNEWFTLSISSNNNTNRKIQDTLGWYHVVAQINTIDSSSSNRFKFWVNGEQITSWQSTGVPAQNALTGCNQAHQHKLGGGYDSVYSLGGKMSQAYLIDGKAVDASSFGFEDPLTGTWRPKTYDIKTAISKNLNKGVNWAGQVSISGSWDGSHNQDKMFDGSAGTRAEPGDGALVTWAPASPITGRLRMLMASGAYSGGADGNFDVKIDGTSYWTTIGGTPVNTTAWRDFGEVTINTNFTFGRDPSGGSNGKFIQVKIVEVDGYVLVTNTVDNSFYLPFDGNSPIGEDKSGLGNDWTPVNIKMPPSQATGALPIFNTINGGNTATVGVRTDSNSSQLKFALPLIGGASYDVSNLVNAGGAAAKTVVTASNLAANGHSEIYGSSTYFNGDGNAEIKYSIPSELDFAGNDFTIELWFRTFATNLEHHYPLIQKGDSSTNNSYDWRLYFAGTGSTESVYFDVKNGPSLDTNYSIIDDRWYHVAICKDSTNLRIYLDGTERDTASWSGGDVDDVFNEICLGHANHGGAGDTWYHGCMQDVRIYNGVAKYTSSFIPASGRQPGIIKDSPSGVVQSSALAKITAGAVSFDGVNDKLSIADSTDWDFDGDFTVECWAYLVGTPQVIVCKRAASGVGPWTLYTNGDILQFVATTDGSSYQVDLNGPKVTLHKWQHCAVTRSGSTVKLWVDGEDHGLSGTLSGTTHNDSTALTIGTLADSSQPFEGLISNLRIVKGTAVYTSSFTPPTSPLTSITNTKLLYCQSNSSTTAYTTSPGAITASGPAATAFNPYDSDIDTVRGQASGYCVMNPLMQQGYGYTFSDGNLLVGKTNDEGWFPVPGTVGLPPRGKWQFEFMALPIGSGQYPYNVKVGWMPQKNQLKANQQGTAGVLVYDLVSGGECKYQLDTESQTSYGAQINQQGQLITLGLDFKKGIAKFAVDGVLRPDLDISASSLFSSGNLIPCMISYYGDGENFWRFNFGQQPFKFSFGEDYKTICTANTESPGLLTPPIQYTKPVLYTGDGTSPRKIGGFDFQPDLVWYKERSEARDWQVYDSVRGVGPAKNLVTNTNYAQTANDDTQYGYTSSFNRDGFTLTNGTGGGNADIYTNKNGQTYVSYCWKAGGNKGTFNIDDVAYASAAAAGLDGGTITPTGASVGTKQGFSILSYTGNGSAGATFEHGLTQAPDIALVKRLDGTEDWAMNIGSISGTAGSYIKMENGAQSTSAAAFNSTNPTSTLITLGDNNITNGNTMTYIVYAWHSVEGVQKFGTYASNNNVDGPYVDLGFEPGLVVIKSMTGSGTARNWALVDSTRSYANVANHTLAWNLNDAESAYGGGESVFGASNKIDLLSNGFKIKDTGNWCNEAGKTYIYLAWAKTPYHNLYGAQSTSR